MRTYTPGDDCCQVPSGFLTPFSTIRFFAFAETIRFDVLSTVMLMSVRTVPLLPALVTTVEAPEEFGRAQA